MARKMLTLTDPSEIEGLEPGGELNGRELLDSKPVAVPVKPVRDTLGPLDKMYAEIRAREKLAADAAYQESLEESYDLDIPDEVDEFLSRYEEQPLEELLGAALQDKRVQEALKAALEGKYGPREAALLQEVGVERGNLPRQASDGAGSSAPPQQAADPSMGEPPASPSPPKA